MRGGVNLILPHSGSQKRQNWDEVKLGKMRQIKLVFLTFLEEKFKSLGRLGTEIKIRGIITCTG